MASPTCQVKDGAGAYGSTVDGVNVTVGNTIIIKLASQAGVTTWGITCLTTDDTSVAATVTAGLAVDNSAKTATYTAPAAGKAYRFQSVVNGGIDQNGTVDASLTTTFNIYTLTSGGVRVLAVDETTEGSASFGWSKTVNDSIRAGSGSAVTSVSGTAPIASSGGTTPAISITAATTGAAGSMSAADKTKCDALPTFSGLTTGQPLRATGATTSAFGALDLANSSAVTGVLPAANRAAPTAAETVTALSTAASSVGVNSQKITSLANGTASTDAVAFGQISWVTRWETDFANVTTYPSNTVYSANGTYSITPSATGSAANFVVANYANSSKFQITSGTGLEITNNTTNSFYTTSRTAPIINASFTQLYPAASFSQKFRVWVRLTGTFVRASDACALVVESTNSGLAECYQAYFAYVAGGKQVGRATIVGSTYAGYGDGANIGSGPDVLMIEYDHGFVSSYYGTWSSGWPAFTALTFLSSHAHTAMSTPSPGAQANRIKLIGEAAAGLFTSSNNVTGGNAMIVKNFRLQSFGEP